VPPLVYKAAAKTLLTESEEHVGMFSHPEAVKVSACNFKMVEVKT